MSIEDIRRRMYNNQMRHNDRLSVAAQPSVRSGRFMVNNAGGEATKEIYFQGSFSSPPIVTFGIDFLPDDDYHVGHAPIVTSQVIDWVTIDRLPSTPLYRGAKILTVSEGPPTSKFIVTWSAVGVAYQDPVSL